MARRKRKHPGIEDRWSSSRGRSGKGMRWRLRMRGLPGHEGTVVELFDDLQKAMDRREKLLHAKSDPAESRVEAGRVRLVDIAKNYLRALREGQDKPTDHYLETVEHVLARAVDAELDDVRSPLWAANAHRWLQNLTAQRHGQKVPTPASEATRRAYRAILGGALNYAVDVKEWITTNPFRKIKARETKAKRLRIASQTIESNAHKIIPVSILSKLVSNSSRWRVDEKKGEVVVVLERHHGNKEAAAAEMKVSVATIYNRLARIDRVEDPRWLIAVLLTYTGMRLGQAVGLEWSDIDLVDRTIRLRPEVVGNKSGKDATVEIEQELFDILETVPRRGALVVPDPVEPNTKKKTRWPLRRQWLTESFDQFLLAHGAVGHTAHDFRHSFVCMLTAMGVPTADVRRRVNHSDVAMTARYADHLLASYRKTCSEWGGVLRLRDRAREKQVLNGHQ